MDAPHRGGPDWVAILTLLTILAVIALGYALFPRLQHFIAFQDCAAAGRTDCGFH